MDSKQTQKEQTQQWPEACGRQLGASHTRCRHTSWPDECPLGSSKDIQRLQRHIGTVGSSVRSLQQHPLSARESGTIILLTPEPNKGVVESQQVPSLLIFHKQIRYVSWVAFWEKASLKTVVITVGKIQSIQSRTPSSACIVSFTL